MDKDAYIDHLIAKLEAGRLTEAEYKTLVDWYNGFDDTEVVLRSESDSAAQLKARMHEGLMARIRPGVRKPRALRNWLPYAAAVLLFLSGGIGWYVLSINNDTRSELASRYGGDAAPGGNRATITLADGRKIDLSEAQTGIVVGNGITYLDGSAVLSENPHTLTPSRPHALTTPKGGTYQITLPDGSKVWLNAASTLKYPSKFTGDERIVELEGEAYFDVAKAEAQNNKIAKEQGWPFRVVSKGQVVEVLGTQFNISAYPDEEETKTTLVEGKVNVSVKGSTPDRPPTTDRRPPITLKPGEQSISRGAVIETKTVDVQQYTAWKNGDFRFGATPLEEVLRQLERWYDIEVDLGEVPDRKIHGVISRSRNLSAILLTIEKTSGVTFKIEGRRLRIEQ